MKKSPMPNQASSTSLRSIRHSHCTENTRRLKPAVSSHNLSNPQSHTLSEESLHNMSQEEFPMIEVTDAKSRVLRHTFTLSIISTKIEDALYKILAEDVNAASSLPDYDASIMDGYEFFSNSLSLSLSLSLSHTHTHKHTLSLIFPL